MSIKDLVPPLELCKLIPAGEFADTAFIWGQYYGQPKPAPTLQEIMEKIAEIKGVLNPTVFQQLTGWVADCAYDPTGEMTEADEPTDDEINRLEIKDCRGKSPTIAALKLWLKLKGIEA